MKKLTCLLALSVLTAAAQAQTVVEPVRYQYGQYSEVFYGGRNPNFTQNAYVYLPPALQTAYNAQRLNGAPYITGYAYGPTGQYYSPFTPDSHMTNPTYTPFIYTDYIPYEEVGQYGYTIDQVRNEAYFNMPRIQHGGQPRHPAHEVAAAQPAEPAAPEAAAPPTDPRLKAVPLLNWVRSLGNKNPALSKALIAEARKYDPAATAATERSLSSER